MRYAIIVAILMCLFGRYCSGEVTADNPPHCRELCIAELKVARAVAAKYKLDCAVVERDLSEMKLRNKEAELEKLRRELVEQKKSMESLLEMEKLRAEVRIEQCIGDVKKYDTAATFWEESSNKWEELAKLLSKLAVERTGPPVGDENENR